MRPPRNKNPLIRLAEPPLVSTAAHLAKDTEPLDPLTPKRTF